MTISDYIFKQLIKHNITNVFSVVGGGAMYLNDAMYKNKELNCYFFHHEQAAAYAAESYARLTNKPAILCVTSGPGSTNVISGVAAAYTDSLPLVVLSGQMQTNMTTRIVNPRLRQLGDQEIDIVGIVKRITKAVIMLNMNNDVLKRVGFCIDKMIDVTLNERMGPVWIDIPLDVQREDINKYKQIGYIKPKSIKNKYFLNDIIKIKSLIKKSKSPVILAGTAVRLSNSLNEFKKLIEKLNIPVLTSFNAYDILDYNHRLNFGKQGTFGERGANIILQNSDLLLILGCRCEVRQTGYDWKNFALKACKVMVDVDKEELSKPTLNIDLKIKSDLKVFIKNMSYSVIEPFSQKIKWIKFCKKMKNKYSILQQKHINNIKLSSYFFYTKLSEYLNRNDIIVTANGGASVIGSQCINIKEGQRFYTNAGFGPMGYGLPAAIGAWIGGNKKRVICYEGDGSIMMNLQELATVRKLNANIKIFILNNSGYFSIRQTQDNYFNSRYIGSNYDDLEFPNFQKIAEAFHIKYIKIYNKENLEENIKRVFCFPGPILIEVVVDLKENFEPKCGKMGLINMMPYLSEKETKENVFL